MLPEVPAFLTILWSLFLESMLPEFSQTTWYRVLYFIFLCQAFLQETRSHMIYHVIKGAWGCFPNKRAMAIIGHPRIACPSYRTLCGIKFCSYYWHLFFTFFPIVCRWRANTISGVLSKRLMSFLQLIHSTSCKHTSVSTHYEQGKCNFRSFFHQLSGLLDPNAI